MKTSFDFVRGRKVLVTGASGLIGSAFVNVLRDSGAAITVVRHRRPLVDAAGLRIVDADLRDAAACRTAARGAEFVIHAAGISGGSRRVTVAAMEMFTDSLLMNTQMLEAARIEGVEGYLFISNSSVYAKSDVPLVEEAAWGDTTRGIPENETGMVKRAAETQCALYSRFTDMRIAIIRAGNAYGPNDNFDLAASHVVPALIRKAVERQQPYVLWGSGQTVRDFIHTYDIGCGGLTLLGQAERHRCFPVNVASGHTITIEALARMILQLTGYTDAMLQLDPAAPPASPAKRIDVTKMSAAGFTPQLSLQAGLRQTIDWYCAHLSEEKRAQVHPMPVQTPGL